MMICKFRRSLLSLALIFTLSPLYAAETPAANTAIASSNSIPAELKPGPDAGKIAFVTAYMLEKLQYLQHPFDATMSAKLFDGYLSALDPQHIHFLQSDLNEFALYRTNLNRLTMRRTGVADTQPAYVIFFRYVDRLKEHVDYVDQLLKTEKFNFTANDRVMLNRHDLPYPKNLAEAKEIWGQRLRYEYLMEKINRETRTNTTAAVTNVDNANVDKTVVHITAAASANPKSMHDQIVETLDKSYHRTLKVFQEWDSNDVLNQYLESLARAYDPHSDYQGKDDYDDFAMLMNLSLSGIGAQLRAEDGYCKIEELLDGPAKLSKRIKIGDRIVKVAQSNQPPVDIVEMPLNKAVRLIRGPKGTEVRLTIIPAGAPESVTKVVSLTRDEIKLESGEAKGKIYDVPSNDGKTMRLGLIDLPSFYATIDDRANPTPRSTTADVAALLKKFKEENVAGVILDLRHNGGGSLEEAIKLTGLFIKEGPVVQIKRPPADGGEVEVRDDTDPAIAYDGPLIVLTSRGSASASEIVAGALQDYGRALIVGDASTFGKGTAQQIFYLSKLQPFADSAHDPGTLKLTNSKFYRASGASTELCGVAADITLPSLWNESTEIGESNLDNHLPYDKIDSSRFQKVNMVQAEIPELTKLSSERIATNKDFAYLRADIDRIRKQRDDKTFSLNEKQQLADRAQIIADHKQRDEERAARKIVEPKVYDLTVKQAGEPGLPPATKQTNDLASADADLNPDADTPPDERDEFSDAVTAEAAHGEAARLQETEDILKDYITLVNNQRATLKKLDKEQASESAQPLSAK
jgi:carboxyl-terminal processing protease